MLIQFIEIIFKYFKETFGEMGKWKRSRGGETIDSMEFWSKIKTKLSSIFVSIRGDPYLCLNSNLLFFSHWEEMQSKRSLKRHAEKWPNCWLKDRNKNNSYFPQSSINWAIHSIELVPKWHKCWNNWSKNTQKCVLLWLRKLEYSFSGFLNFRINLTILK